MDSQERKDMLDNILPIKVTRRMWEDLLFRVAQAEKGLDELTESLEGT